MFDISNILKEKEIIVLIIMTIIICFIVIFGLKIFLTYKLVGDIIKGYKELYDIQKKKNFIKEEIRKDLKSLKIDKFSIEIKENDIKIKFKYFGISFKIKK